jgi:hypothetical protein
MSPAPEIAKITIHSKDNTDPLEMTLSASGQDGPSRVQWKAPNGTFRVRFPAGVFKRGPVDQIIMKGDIWQPEPALQLLSSATFENYIEEVTVKEATPATEAVTAKEELTAKPMAGTPIIIVKR